MIGFFRSAGFTLLEVLVALAIVSIVFVGIVGAAKSHIDTTSYLEQKFAAVQVASNLATELVFKDISNVNPFDEDVVEMGNWPLRWLRRIEVEEDVLAIDVWVGEDLGQSWQGVKPSDGVLYSLSWKQAKPLSFKAAK